MKPIWIIIVILCGIQVVAAEKGVPSSGFTVTLSLIDVMMINKALMLLPDDHAMETLASVRKQILEQTKAP